MFLDMHIRAINKHVNRCLNFVDPILKIKSLTVSLFKFPLMANL